MRTATPKMDTRIRGERVVVVLAANGPDLVISVYLED